MPGYKKHGTRIYVPQRSIQGGLGEKFETDPYDVELHGLMTEHQYTEAIENLNAKLRPSRPTSFDGALLATGPLLVPLGVWGVRHRNQVKRRKRLLKEAIHEFNMQYQELYMRWNRRPESTLTIERRHYNQNANNGTIIINNNNNNQYGGGDDGAATPAFVVGQEEAHVAEATLVSDVIAPATSVVVPLQQQQQQQAPPRQPSSSGLV
mmetsp:Transcript_15109/g.37249  ORF Transcript_15109/g.37249 Transcript_15109/m.37249 type:complete len:208 (-) Transcript_15109:187-810(-)|eukprot:CAMPEP_0113463268 /NCGR_PEP_ID=MMETSP0014_2-20120614/12552_1 /TAXON_ID=2857 /ORGANISM="Nitzschia sp." /LENGTH=207 /DNA_ID=CAMNT_0000355221 /DNA_START=484 /DNA_END=1107 /DNA_ORIENTATION=- /assembly_acc=CAM_ASM_000159